MKHADNVSTISSPLDHRTCRTASHQDCHDVVNVHKTVEGTRKICCLTSAAVTHVHMS